MDTYPYWPYNPKQPPANLAARWYEREIIEVASGGAAIPPANGVTVDIPVIPFPSVAVQTIDTLTANSYNPIMGRSAGPGLVDYFMAPYLAVAEGKKGKEKK